LAIIPAGNRHSVIAAGDTGDVGIGSPAQPLRDARQDSVQPRRGRANDDGRLGGAAKSLGCGCVGRVTRLGEVGAADAKKAGGAAGSYEWRRR
jgi:hypothetical protein